jgi:manganese/zinc/iron transport system substrate-binding protein
MIADAVRCIAGDAMQVKALMGPGVDPHTYRARQSDLEELMHADLILFHGLHLEGKLVEILHHGELTHCAKAVTRSLDTTQLILSDAHAELYDPHVWHDVTLWREVVQEITRILCDYDPQHVQLYHERAKAYDAELAVLDGEIHRTLSMVPHNIRSLVTSHDAFRYFGRAYGYHVQGIQGISTDAQPSARDIQLLVEYLVQHRIPAIFCESSTSPRAIRSLQEKAQARGLRVHVGAELFSDALGVVGSSAQTYVGMMQCNAQAIAHALLDRGVA